MLACLVVAILGRTREQMQNLKLGLLQLGRPLLNPLFEQVVLLLHLQVKVPRLQQVVDAEHDLGGVKRLRNKVVGAQMKRLFARARGVVGGKHHDGQEAALADQRTQLPQHSEPVDDRHVKIEQHHIWRQLAEEPLDLRRVGCTVQIREAGSSQHMLQQHDIRGLIVCDQNFGILRPRTIHGHLSSAKVPSQPFLKVYL